MADRRTGNAGAIKHGSRVAKRRSSTAAPEFFFVFGEPHRALCGVLPAGLGDRLANEMALEEIKQVAVERLELLQCQAHGVAGDVLGNVGAALARHALAHPLSAGNEFPGDLLGDLAAGPLVQRQVGGAGAAADGAVAVVVGDEIKRLGRGSGKGWLAAGGFAEGGWGRVAVIKRLQREGGVGEIVPIYGYPYQPIIGLAVDTCRSE